MSTLGLVLIVIGAVLVAALIIGAVVALRNFQQQRQRQRELIGIEWRVMDNTTRINDAYLDARDRLRREAPPSTRWFGPPPPPRPPSGR